jgi:cell division protease FtsH
MGAALWSFRLLWIFIMRRMGGRGAVAARFFNIGKSKAQLFDRDLVVKITFNDVAGLEEAKVEVMEIVDFLKNPKKYTTLGGKIPRGALLVGPREPVRPCLQKPLPVKPRCLSSHSPGSDFVEMFVGVGSFPRTRPLPPGQRKSAVHHFHRRNRCHRPCPRQSSQLQRQRRA